MEVPLSVLTAALGMSTARWMDLPAEQIPVASLTPTQVVSTGLWTHSRRSHTTSGDPCVHVVELAGVRWLEDGHHRLARAVRDGQPTIAARVLQVTFRGASAYPRPVGPLGWQPAGREPSHKPSQSPEPLT